MEVKSGDSLHGDICRKQTWYLRLIYGNEKYYVNLFKMRLYLPEKRGIIGDNYNQ